MLLRLRKTIYAGLALTFAALLCAPAALAQTFRGQLSGVVLDAQGAAITKAPIILKNPSTGIIQNGISNHVGEFTFPELQPGIYSVSVTMPGFETARIDDINVAVSSVATVKVVMAIGSENTVVDVQANGVEVDTASSALVSVVDTQAVADEPMNGRDFTKMVRFTAGVVGSGYANGNSHINFQVDGVDNVDAYLGIVASNQGGIAGVPGGLIPIEAIDQFSIQSQGEADQGRNAGANQNMVMKSGTNQIHGDLFYFNRNEFFAAITPVQAVGSRKAAIRNNQFGFTLGGPVWKDHTFLFFAGEIQLASAGNSINSTVLNDAWIGSTAQNGGKLSVAAQMNQFYGLSTTPNPVTAALYTNINRTSANPNDAAVLNNYLATSPNQYNSYNGVIKLDHHFSEKESIAMRYIGTTGKQTAYVGSVYASMFQTAPMHIHNGSIIQTSIINPKMLNQLTLGINYFLQTFNDANQGYYPAINDGLNVGAVGVAAEGSPTVSVSGFSGTIGETQTAGRTDVTGQINDSFRWTLGKHSLKIGGEYRHTNVNSIGLGSSRGSFSFTGTGGPWSASSVGFTPTVTVGCTQIDNTLSSTKPSSSQVAQCAAQYCEQIAVSQGLPYYSYWTSGAPVAAGANPAQARSETCLSNVLSASDYFLGQTPATTGSSSLRVGVGTRIFLINQEDFWMQDDFQATRKLSVNYGVRWSIPGVVYDAQNDLTSWKPTTPGQGAYVQPIYHEYYKALAPRIGFAYNPYANSKTVLRGAWGIIYDVPAMSTMVASSSGNPAGPDPSYVGTINSFMLQSGVNAFAAAKAPAVLPANGVNQNYRIAYQENFSLGIEQQFSKSSLVSVGYSGSEGRRLPVTYDYNQATACGISSCGVTTAYPGGYIRPYDNANAGAPGIYFAGQVVASASPFTGVHELVSGGISNFNSLNVTFRQATWKGLSFNVNYIWSKRMDDGTAPTDNLNNASSCTNCANGRFPNGIAGPGIKMDYGIGAGNTAHTFDGFISYSLPKFHFAPKLTQGWQVNGLFSFYTGGALNPTIGGTEYSLQGESGDRPNRVYVNAAGTAISPYIPKTTTTTSTGARVYTTINRAAFDYPIAGDSNPQYNPTNTNYVYNSVTNPNVNTFGVYGNMRRDSLTSTAFGDFDFSLFKYTPITEKVKSEFRVEVFNLFNQSNLAGPGVALSSGTSFGQITNTAQASSNPGMGYGEPFNVQFALKLIF